MRFGRRPSGRSQSGLGLRTCRALVAAVTSLAWLWVSPAQASSSQTVTTAGPVNLFQGDQATFDKSIGAWANYSDANLQWSRSAGVGGTGGLVMTATGPKMAVVSGTPANGGLTPASPGSIYSAGLSGESPSGTEPIQTVLIFYTATGATNGSVFGPGASVGTGGWTTPAPVVAIAPANTTSVALAVIVYNAGAGSELVLDNAWIEKTAEATTPAVVGPLSTSGNRVLEANGVQFVPRGVVLNGLETLPAASTVTQQAVIQAKVWGANVVRVPLGEQFWLPSNCDYSPVYQAVVNQVVNWITSLGMVALLDLHTNTVLGCEPGGPHNMADEAQSPTFWSQVAAQYGSNPLVAFDLYNEPHDITDQVWLNGGLTIDTFAPFEVYQAAGMQQLYNSVRATGAKNLVIVSGTNWGNNPPSQPLTGSNIVYAAHAYTCPNSPPPQCDSPTPYDPSTILDRWITFSSSEPVAVTEFGWPSQSEGTYANNVIAQARSHGWGWIAFAWEDAAYPAPFNITEGWSPNSPAEPAPSGIPVLCELVLVSTGASPCVAPPIVSPTTPKSQAIAPTAPAGGPSTKNEPTAAATLAQPAVVGAPTAAGALGSLARHERLACPVACDSSSAAVGTVHQPTGKIGRSGHPSWSPVSLLLRLASILAALGVFLLPPIVRRVVRVDPARA